MKSTAGISAGFNSIHLLWHPLTSPSGALGAARVRNQARSHYILIQRQDWVWRWDIELYTLNRPSSSSGASVKLCFSWGSLPPLSLTSSIKYGIFWFLPLKLKARRIHLDLELANVRLIGCWLLALHSTNPKWKCSLDRNCPLNMKLHSKYLTIIYNSLQ